MAKIDQMTALSRIYDAAVDPGAWVSAMTHVSGALEAKAAVLLVRDRTEALYKVMALSEPYNLMMATHGLTYMQEFSHYETPDWQAYDQWNPGDPHPDTACGLTPEDRDARPDYVFMRETFQVRRRLGARLNENRVWFDALTSFYAEDQLSVPNHAYAVTRFLAPHLAKSVELGRMFGELRARYNAVLSVLDRVGVGLGVALANGEFVTVNAEARRLFSLEDGLSLGADRRLKFHDADRLPEVEHAIRTAADTAAGDAARHSFSMALARPSEKSAFLMEVSPLRDAKEELEPALHGAFFILIDPDHVPHLKLDRFQTLYGLTASEADVARLLLQGLEPAQIAEERRTSQHTVRNQIASVYAKSGARNRSDLVRLIVRVLPPVS